MENNIKLGKMEYATHLKGLENETGSNNCFLNVIIQSFWHLTSFRTSFQLNSYDHSHSSVSLCLICELRVYFI